MQQITSIGIKKRKRANFCSAKLLFDILGILSKVLNDETDRVLRRAQGSYLNPQLLTNKDQFTPRTPNELFS